jgi:hypothetical protein
MFSFPKKERTQDYLTGGSESLLQTEAKRHPRQKTGCEKKSRSLFRI